MMTTGIRRLCCALFIILQVNCVRLQNYCTKRFDNNVKTLDLINEQLTYLWSQLDFEITSAQDSTLKARRQSNRNNIALIELVIIGNVLKLAARVSNKMSRA